MQTDNVPAGVETADVVVVGGGVAGAAAAIAAARRGARVVLLERFARLGGMATGGLVLLWDDMADSHAVTVEGLVTEILERLIAAGGAVHSAEDARFTSTTEGSRRWASWGFEDLWSRKHPKIVTYAASVDPEALSWALYEMATGAGVDVRLGSSFVDAVVTDGRLTTVSSRSKLGETSLRAAVFIDASGDGDLFAAAGAAHVRSSYLMTLAHRLGNVDIDRYLAWADSNPDLARELNRQVKDLYGSTWHNWWLRTPLPGVVWCNCPHFPSLEGLDPLDQTHVVGEGNRRIRAVLGFIRRELPGFQDAFLLDTASQVGVRQTRLLVGEYVLTKDDVMRARWFEDRVGRGRDYYYPYRSLLPKAVEGLLVAGRCFSATPEAQRISREIPPMVTLGQAAGVAASLSLERGVSPRFVDVKELQASLVRDGANLGSEREVEIGSDQVTKPPTNLVPNTG